jgi:hypothetical protein
MEKNTGTNMIDLSLAKVTVRQGVFGNGFAYLNKKLVRDIPILSIPLVTTSALSIPSLSSGIATSPVRTLCRTT